MKKAPSTIMAEITSAFSKYCTLDCQLWSHMACILHVCCRKPGFPLSAVTPLRILSMKSTNRDLYSKILAMEDNLHKLEGKSSWTQHLDTVVQVLYCTVLYCTLLYCTVLYCTVLYCTVLYCTILYCTVLYCTVLYCTILYCTAGGLGAGAAVRGRQAALQEAGQGGAWLPPGWRRWGVV